MLHLCMTHDDLMHELMWDVSRIHAARRYKIDQVDSMVCGYCTLNRSSGED